MPPSIPLRTAFPFLKIPGSHLVSQVDGFLKSLALITAWITLAPAAAYSGVRYTGSSNFINYGTSKISYIGNSSPGTATLDDGTAVNDQGSYFQLGSLSTGSGTISISGAGSQWSFDGTTYSNYIGDAGIGFVDLSDYGKLISASSVHLAYSATGSGTLQVQTHAEFTSLDLVIGRAGNGAMDILSGGKVTTNRNATLSVYQGSKNASVQVSGAGSEWNGNGTLTLNTNSTLVIKDGGKATFTGEIKNQASLNGTTTVSVTGANSLLSTADKFTTSATDVITLAGGGKLRAASLRFYGTTLKIGTGSGVAPGTLDAASIEGLSTDRSTLEFNHNASDYAFARDNGSGIDLFYNLAVNILSGTTTLSGNSTYGGGTTISSGAKLILADSNGNGLSMSTSGSGYGNVTVNEGGTLQIGNGGITGTLWSNATIANSGTVIYDRSDLYYLVADLAGAGDLIVQGTGTLFLNGNKTYTGDTFLKSGVLQSTSTGALGDGGLISFEGGALAYSFIAAPDLSARFSQAAGQQYNLVLNGGGMTLGAALTSAGGSLSLTGGSFTLSAINTIDGGVTINGANVTVAAGASLAGSASSLTMDSGTLRLENTSQTIGALSGSGSSASIQFYNLTIWHTLTTNTDSDSSFAGQMTGPGHFVKAGNGSLTLSNTQNYGGSTTIRGGKLIVNGSIATSLLTTVEDGGTLSGSGTVGALNLTNGGILAPGNSPGKLTVGNTTWAGGGTYLWEINDATGTSTTNWDILTIQGTLTFTDSEENPFLIDIRSLTSVNESGQLVNFDASLDYIWQILSSTGSITNFDPAHFGFITTHFDNDLNGGAFSVSQQGNGLYLNFTAAVPEPRLWMLGLMGLVGAVLRRRRGVAVEG